MNDELDPGRYEFWAHMPSGEKYAVRIDDGIVTGSCGPLHHSEVTLENLPDFHYADSPKLTEWIIAEDEQFGRHVVTQ